MKEKKQKFRMFSVLMQVLKSVGWCLGCVGVGDLMSGHFHFFLDRYWDEKTPIVGAAFGRDNIVHHHYPRHFLRKTFWQSSWDTTLIWIALCGVLHMLHLFSFSVWIVLTIALFTPEIHKCEHRPRAQNWRVVTILQDWHVLQDAKTHHKHHSGEKDTYFCMVTTFTNPVLERIGYWRHLERLIFAVFGVHPRRDTSVHGPPPPWLKEINK